jgi:hypothetical protein
MPAIITTHARERNNYVVTINITDEAGSACVPDILTWTLSDMDGNIINSRSAASATTIATTCTIVMVGSDLTIVSGQTNERLLLVEWIYDSTYGNDLVGKEQATFIIDELLKVS